MLGDRVCFIIIFEQPSIFVSVLCCIWQYDF